MSIVCILVVLSQIVPEPEGGPTHITLILVESLLLPMTSALVFHKLHFVVVHGSAVFAFKRFNLHNCCHSVLFKIRKAFVLISEILVKTLTIFVKIPRGFSQNLIVFGQYSKISVKISRVLMKNLKGLSKRFWSTSLSFWTTSRRFGSTCQRFWPTNQRFWSKY